jgi:imidazolonepropionase-like amidohydrolase
MSKHLNTLRLSLLIALTSVLTHDAFGQNVVAIRNATVHTAADAGTLESATILIEDGRITDVGTDVKIPVTAKVIDATGQHVIPGIVDPYYDIDAKRSATASNARTVVVNGRTFTIGGNAPSDSTELIKLAEVLDSQEFEFNSAIRSGITTLNLITSGYCQTAVARPIAGSAKDVYLLQNGILHTSATNETKSLNIIRSGLTKPKSNSKGKSSDSGKEDNAKKDNAKDASSKSKAPDKSADSKPPELSENSSDAKELWAKVRSGDLPVIVNANNPAAVLHINKIQESSEDAKIIYILTGASVYLAADQLDAKTQSVVVAPQIDTQPNSQIRINTAKLLADTDVPFAMSLSMSSSQLRIHQDTPLFPLAILIRSGLPEDVALQSITLNPAKLLGIDSVVGSIEAGKYGNLVLLDGAPFGTYTQINRVLLEGEPIEAR